MSNATKLPEAIELTTEHGIEAVRALWAANSASNPEGVKFGGKRGKAALAAWCEAASFDVAGDVGLWLITELPAEAAGIITTQATRAAQAEADRKIAEAAKSKGKKKPSKVSLAVAGKSHKLGVNVPGLEGTWKSPYHMARIAIACIRDLPGLLETYDLNPDNLVRAGVEREYNARDNEATKAARAAAKAEALRKGKTEAEAVEAARAVKHVRKDVGLTQGNAYYPCIEGEGMLHAAQDLISNGAVKTPLDECFPQWHAALLRFVEFAEAVNADETLSAMIEGAELDGWPLAEVEAAEGDEGEAEAA